MHLPDYEKLKEFQVPAFGYELLREVLIPDILGKDHASMLYWAGKSLARKFPMESLEDVSGFFEQAGWGSLQLLSKKKNELEFELSGEFVLSRLQSAKEAEFQLEAGFLAQQVEFLTKQLTEAFEQPRKKHKKITFRILSDPKDPAIDNM
ncbi:DUF2507 domain-containing protein [Bacillus lacus]|uniref:DUF2507 domain-containing protein n=2 Tax=Metabacillus lacus TaxID=1983721 RepID=A0A7X2IXU9_9BACI|nr:YslB family protein [Metabacillus lacus]MRX71808.1 DUF2507 domain-containing protein [Metabacillus lacus]